MFYIRATGLGLACQWTGKDVLPFFTQPGEKKIALENKTFDLQCKDKFQLIRDKPEAVPLQGSNYTSCAAAGLSVIATEKECEEAAKSLGFAFEGSTDSD